MDVDMDLQRCDGKLLAPSHPPGSMRSFGCFHKTGLDQYEIFLKDDANRGAAKIRKLPGLLLQAFERAALPVFFPRAL